MSQLVKLIDAVDKAPSARDAMILCQDRWIKNYYITTGKKDGDQRFQAELLNLLDIAAEKPVMTKAPKFEFFKAMMKISRTGLSLASEGHLYIETYESNGKVVIKVTKGNHGKREMLQQMKEVKFVSPGRVVVKGDEFEFDVANDRVLVHKSSDKSATANSLDVLLGVYCRVEYHDGRIVDTYMKQSEIIQAKNKSKNKRDDGPWAQWPLEMAKKVVYGRAYKNLYRAPEGIELIGGEDDDDDTQDTSYETVSDVIVDGANVDTETGEVKEQQPAQEAKVVENNDDAQPFT